MCAGVVTLTPRPATAVPPVDNTSVILPGKLSQLPFNDQVCLVPDAHTAAVRGGEDPPATNDDQHSGPVAENDKREQRKQRM